MELKKILAAGLLFVATGVSVIAADPYTELGGRAVGYRDMTNNLKLKGAAGGVHELTLDVDVMNKLKRVNANQFTASEKTGGSGSAKYRITENIVNFMQGFYNALEAAAGEVSGRPGDEALSLWIQGLKPAQKVIKVNLNNKTNVATLNTDNAAVLAQLQQRVKFEILNASDTAAMLEELKGTLGAQRPARGDYANVQAAYEAYNTARSSNDVAGMQDVLAKAAALKFGSNSRDLRYVADKEKRVDRTTAEMRVAKAKVAAKKGGAGVTGDVKVANDAFELLLERVEDGHFAPLAALDRDLAREFEDATTILRSDADKAGRLIDALIKFSKQQRQLKNDILLLKQRSETAESELKRIEAEAVAASMRGKASSKPSGKATHTSLAGVDDDGMGLFGDD